MENTNYHIQQSDQLSILMWSPLAKIQNMQNKEIKKYEYKLTDWQIINLDVIATGKKYKTQHAK